MKWSTISAVFTTMTACMFWIVYWFAENGNWVNDPTARNLLFHFTLKKFARSLKLFSPNLQGLSDPDKIDAIFNTMATTVTQMVVNEFCRVNVNSTSTIFYAKCCVNWLENDRSALFDCLRMSGDVGEYPVVAVDEASIPTEPIKYQHPEIYTGERDASNRPITCPVETDIRRTMYGLLLEWIRFADQHRIVWWLCYGALLGAVRNQDFIPYDHDVDVAIFDSEEHLIRQFAGDRSNIDYSKPVLLTRNGELCTNGITTRLNCQNMIIWKQKDACSFCEPFARIVSRHDTFLDIFSVRAYLSVNQTAATFGLLDEVLDAYKGRTVSYPLSHVFPLDTCYFMGLRLPCPRNATAVLSYIYGSNFMRPRKLCNPLSGQWYENV